MEGIYVHATHNLARFTLFLSHPLHLTATPTSHLKDAQRWREQERENQGERKEGATKESKHLGNGVLYIHPQEKGVGRLFGLLCLVQKYERDGGRREDNTNHKNPPFLVFYCHLIQFIAPVLLTIFCCLLILFLIFCIPFL